MIDYEELGEAMGDLDEDTVKELYRQAGSGGVLLCVPVPITETP